MNDAAPTPTQELEPGVMYCANHPTVETGLRCNNCNKPICAKCARLTPTGYRCKECISGQQKAFDTTQWYDYPLAFFVAGLLSLAGSYITTYLGWFMLFLAPVAGVIIGEAVRLVTRRRRSPLLFKIAVVGVVMGILPVTLIWLVSVFFLQAGTGGLLGLVFQGAYAFLAASSAYYRLGGISLK
jgi:hypothetical protein